MSKKTEKLIKPKKSKKPIRILKKPTGFVWFQFYKFETKKTKPNRFEPVFVLKNQTKLKPIGLNRFWFF
jgi:hypothetical protein